jgi:hypothetical protein
MDLCVNAFRLINDKVKKVREYNIDKLLNEYISFLEVVILEAGGDKSTVITNKRKYEKRINFESTVLDR